MKTLFFKILRWGLIIILIIILFIIGLVQYSKYELYSTYPEIPIKYQKNDFLLISNDSSFTYGNNWAKRNKYGLWEVFLTGSSFERGVAYGNLIEKPIHYQEEIFVNSINKVVPSEFYQWFLKNLIYLFHIVLQLQVM